jgi:hypothetical protein
MSHAVDIGWLLGPHSPAELAFAGSPAQWGLLVVVAVCVLAPRLLPVLARVAGRWLGHELRRRAGLPGDAGRRPRRAVARPDVEVLPPEAAQTPVAAPWKDAALRPGTRPGGRPVWQVGAVAGGAIAVLLWYLLHSR